MLLVAPSVAAFGFASVRAQDGTPEIEGTPEVVKTVTETPSDDPTAELTAEDPAAETTTVEITTAADNVGTPAADVAGHPVHIHAGTCNDLGEVVAPLTDLRAGGEEGDTETEGSDVEEESGLEDRSPAGIDDIAELLMEPNPVETSFTTVDLSLDELIDGDYAINAHLSAGAIETYIACGTIGGARLPDGAVAIGLRALNDSGFAGIAYLAPNANDASQTVISVFLAENLIGERITDHLTVGDDATPEADDDEDGA